MAYLELTLEGYDNLIKAAGNRAAQVAKVCQDQGCWEAAAADEAPPGAVQTELDMPDAEPTAEPETGTLDILE